MDFFSLFLVNLKLRERSELEFVRLTYPAKRSGAGLVPLKNPTSEANWNLLD